MDRLGTLRFQGRFEECGPFREGLATVTLEPGRCGCIDSSGDLAIGPFPAVWPFSNGRGCIRNESGDCCYIDAAGDVVIPPAFVYAYDFSEGRARVTFHYGGDFGYIDTCGATVIEPQFGSAEPFRHGLALVSSARPDRRQYIDRKGKIIWDGRMIPVADDEILMPEEHED